MPFRPRKCIGKNVALKPTKISQKDNLPQNSGTIRPKNFGNQKWMAASRAKVAPPIST
ncbi:hypothetical protein D3C83_271890 [compost metagenome]